MRDAFIMDFTINDCPQVGFRETEGNTESVSIRGFKDKVTAIREIGLWKYHEVWKELARR